MTNGPQVSAVRQAWPKRNLALFMLLSANFLCFADRYVLASVVPGLRKDIFGDPEHYWAPVRFMIRLLQPLLGSNPENAMIGVLNMGFMVTYMFGAPYVATLKIQRWYIIGVGLILWSFATGGSGYVSTFEMMLLTRMMVGVGEAAYGPLAPTLISDMFPTSMRAMAMSIYAMATPFGSAAGYALGGYMMVAYGWRWAFYVAVIPGVVLGIACFFMKDPVHAAATAEPKPTWKDRMMEFKLCLHNRSFAYNMFASTAMTFAIGGVGFWIPSYIVEYRGLGNPEFVNLLFGGILVLGGVGGTLCGGWLSDRLNHKDRSAYMKTSACSMALTLPCTIAMLYVPFPYAWGFLGLAVFCLFFNAGSVAAIITNVTAPSMRASAFAISIFFTHALGDVISPFIIGAIADGTGGNMNVAFLAVSAAVAVAAVLWWKGMPHLAADSKYAEQ